MLDSEQRRLLGEFVRAHREKLPPVTVGRRRTPGLRREELAEKAGISATWCAWIEQGRQVQASAQALSRLAEALELTRAERAYLFELADRRDPDIETSAPVMEAPASLTAAVAAMPHPSYALDRYWNACCWNSAAASLFPDWLGDKVKERNLLRYVFLDPVAPLVIVDWQERALRLLAEFRADFSHSSSDYNIRKLVDMLRGESAIFNQGWQEQTVLEREGGERAFRHPERGFLRYRQFNFRPVERSDYKLVMLFPL
ncbi:helix-turn-helix transcriptional regulator [Allorhizobium sp. BGMRC 0089]|uniref:helix-turn-helix transcriptional regulator n=1 Tax=Allorhizobium sonneratiae TaxID=2934936 RepID=UPI002033A5F1|nr:helix-turn-helix transcriptional regulator [Allorhizobium sonneratiae]MCM2292949.1 helix-turn-helix transcriptional regulator [Allorhizobium sonneratiae]